MKKNNKKSLSVFKPVDPNLYKVIISEMKEIKNNYVEEVKEWSEITTKYILLKYKIWQLKYRKTMSLQIFYSQCSNELLKDMKIKKTSNQVRHKINNTRSSFHLLLEQIQKGTFKWEENKSHSFSKSLFDFMCCYFNTDQNYTLDSILNHLQDIIHNQQ